ncbi:MAG: hypothetical protein HY874_08020 [Chloroflexi bacterium]|nr:hypothetical protein [Chloroflexota bacterium]
MVTAEAGRSTLLETAAVCVAGAASGIGVRLVLLAISGYFTCGVHRGWSTNIPWLAGLAVALVSTWPWARLHPRSRIVTWAATWILFTIGTIAALVVVWVWIPSGCSHYRGSIPLWYWPF